MRFLCALFLGLAIVAAQVLHGGLQWPAFLLPSSVLLILAGVMTLFAVVRNRAPAAPGAVIGVAVFAGYVIWRCVHGLDLYLSRVELQQTLLGALAFFVASSGLGDARSRFAFLGILLVAATGQAILGFVQFSLGGFSAPLGWFSLNLKAEYAGRFLTRSHGLFINPNHFAWFETWAALFCVALACWARTGVVMRILLGYLALMFLVAGVLSGSRGGMAALMAGLITFGLASGVAVCLTIRRGGLPIVLGVGTLLAVCAGAIFTVYSGNWVAQARVDSLQSLDVREFYLRDAFRLFQTFPLLGAGPEAFRYAARLYRVDQDNFSGDALFAHDDWLQTLAEYGVVGLGLALLAVAILLGGGLIRFLQTVRLRALGGDRPFSNSGAILLGALSATVAFCVHSLTDFNLHIPANAMLAGATLGLLASTLPGERKGAARLPVVILRVLGGVGTATLVGALALMTWQHGPADYQSLAAANAFAVGNVKTALAHTERGLRWQPDDAALLATKGRALYAFESAQSFEGTNALSEEAVMAQAAKEEALEAQKGDAADDEEEAEEEENVPAIKELTPEERRKLYQSSADAFAAAQKQQPAERAFYVERGKALAETGAEAEAVRQYLAAIELDPRADFTYGALGDYFYEKDQLPRALRIFTLGAPLMWEGYCATREKDVAEELFPPPDAGDSQ